MYSTILFPDIINGTDINVLQRNKNTDKYTTFTITDSW